MGERGRTKRPDRMARLRIIISLVLVLSAHIDVGSPMMQSSKRKTHQEEWRNERAPDKHSNSGVSRPKVHSKSGVSRPEVRSKVDVSHQEVHSEVGVSHLEVYSKVWASHPKVHSKAGITRPKVFENLFRLDGHLNRLKQTGNVLNVKDCPSDCHCGLVQKGNRIALFVSNCKYDPINSLPKLFISHRNITQLNLVNCQLHRLPPEIMKLSLLTLVILDMNVFTELPKRLFELPQLKELDMNYNKLSHLPLDITKCSTLIWLELAHNMIAVLPQEVEGMRNLRVLNLTHNELQSLPQGIGAFSQLDGLDISYNKLWTLPTEVGDLNMLAQLFLANNQLKTLPGEITKLKQLLNVDLSNNPLGEVPPLPIEVLVEIACENCSIQSLPCDLFNKGRIREIFLANNDIKNIDCLQKYNDYLYVLDLVNNALQEVPCKHKFNIMRAMGISDNNISTFPKECRLFHSSVFEQLYFHRNKIDTLHFSSFCTEVTMGKLKYVGFGHNRIRTIDTSDSPLQQCFSPGARIELGKNKLSALDSWPMLLSQDKSITVGVRGNNLSVFTSPAGSFLHASQYGSVFDMRLNQIKHFMDVFDGWNVIVNTTEDLNNVLKNGYFNLGYNPLVCDCVDYEVYRYIQRLRTEQYNNLVCREPKSLMGQNPHKIPLIYFVCDVDVNCPDGCTCTNVPHAQTLNVTCLSYNETDIPDVTPNLPEQDYEYRLDICHQNLHEITFRPYLVKTTEIRLSNNSVMAIKINSSRVFRRVKILHVDNNRLQRLPVSVAGMANESAVEVRLGSNPWVCDCEAMAMKNWIMQNWHIVTDKDIITCHSPPKMVGVKVINIDRSMVCPEEKKTAVYVVAAISSAVFISIVSLYIYDRLKYANWRWVGSDECDGEFKEFDVFMCACSADADADYVENFLIPELERRDFRVCYHREHFHGGKPIHVNMSEAIEKSKRTLVFFSNSFNKSGYSMFEFHSAHDLDIQNRTRRLITIKDTDLDMSKLETSEVYYFRTHTYITREDVKFWKLLEGSLPKKRLGAQVRRY